MGEGSKVSNLCKTQTSSFVAGRIKHYLPNWKRLTSDQNILNIVKGLNIEFETPPRQTFIPKQYALSTTEEKVVQQEIANLLMKGGIEVTTHEPDEFLSNIFLRPNKDGSYRMILQYI